MQEVPYNASYFNQVINRENRNRPNHQVVGKRLVHTMARLINLLCHRLRKSTGRFFLQLDNKLRLETTASTLLSDANFPDH